MNKSDLRLCLLVLIRKGGSFAGEYFLLDLLPMRFPANSKVIGKELQEMFEDGLITKESIPISQSRIAQFIITKPGEDYVSPHADQKPRIRKEYPGILSLI